MGDDRCYYTQDTAEALSSTHRRLFRACSHPDGGSDASPWLFLESAKYAQAVGNGQKDQLPTPLAAKRRAAMHQARAVEQAPMSVDVVESVLDQN